MKVTNDFLDAMCDHLMDMECPKMLRGHLTSRQRESAMVIKDVLRAKRIGRLRTQIRDITGIACVKFTFSSTLTAKGDWARDLILIYSNSETRDHALSALKRRRADLVITWYAIPPVFGAVYLHCHCFPQQTTAKCNGQD